MKINKKWIKRKTNSKSKWKALKRRQIKNIKYVEK